MTGQSLRTNDCFEEDLLKYSDLIYRIAYMNVRIKADADDVFQEVWCRYYQKNIVFESEEHKRYWLINVTLKCCKKIYSSSWYKKTVFIEDFPGLKEELPQKDYDVYNAVMNLPHKYRVPIYLFYYENLSVDEISKATSTNPSTVRSQLKRGREKIEHLLKGVELNG